MSTVADTIQKIEGYYPGSLSYRLNNPGNLVYAGQPGATPVTVGSHTWASFPSYDAGYQALEAQVALDAGRGLTIQQFVNKYAPASDANNPTSYAASIASATGLSVDAPLSAALSGPSATDTLDTGTQDSGSPDATVLTTPVVAGALALLAGVWLLSTTR